MRVAQGLGLALVLAKGCGPKRVPPAPGPAPAAQTLTAPSAAAPVLRPEVVPDWSDDWPAVPPQPGLAVGQELTAALRSRSRFSVEADVSALGALDGEAVGRLFEELAADPRWKVTRWAGQTVAFWRSRRGDGWRVGWGGYSGVDPLSRVALWSGAPAWQTEAQVNRVDASTEGASSLSAAGWPVGGAWEGQTGALLAVQGPGMALEVHEIATDLQLVRTAHALSRVPLRLKEAVRGLPPRHPVAPARESSETVWVASWDEGGVDLRLSIQTNAPGWTWVRLVGPEGPVEPELVLRASLERLGTGAAHQAGQSVIPLSDLPEPVEVEVWFQADTDDDPRRLLTKTLTRP